ncbi:transcription termination factor NusA [Aerococcus sanguinicola]|uniref:Transcription termination/antitermination protein NusA n=1 Tax=Aerococcus sanguinicola TaxID=119206 RepID=A0A0X8FCH5_9LACT|nr:MULTISPECIES: transcription termination factor NusA [Aerococcus]AMB94723.1 transcription elongation factor NusA [Aerococcus sanguinicola]MDK7050936.1 transcription termination factor NusA [Aerococcus sanguinicola]OFT96474.1 transcription termination/antitermination protein NusA [Aerococcus sp. HMSC23C02]PKZ23275.1 transcription termination/antitermination protein NusA [Aerococcus sanguinicola]
MGKELIQAFETLENEKGISKEVIIEALEAALVSAYKRNYKQAQNVEVHFDEKKGEIKVYAVKEVVDLVMDSTLEVSLEEAHERNTAYEVGDKIRFEVTPKDFGRIAAQTAKQVVTQRIREAERNIIYNEFIDYEDDLLTGTVERQDRRYVYINLGKIEAALTPEGQIPGEHFESHDRVQVYVERVENTTKGPQIYVSRSHPNMLKRLFEQEVPEIYDGTVEIKAIAREAGDRSKMAVYSHDPNVDAVGTCVGPRGSRVQTIVDELHGENMDIVEWTEDPAQLIKNALNPAEVLEVHFVPNERSCVVVVPNHHLSLAIGKRGQNARLAAKLTNYKIDIKSEEEFDAFQASEEYEALFHPEMVEEEVLAEEGTAPAEPAEDDELLAVADEVEAIEEEVAAEDLDDQGLRADDIEEGNLGPDQMEDAVADIENDSETSYDDLQEDFEI